MFYLGRRHTSPDDYVPQNCTAHTECVYSPGSNNGRSRERTTKGNGTVLLVNSKQAEYVVVYNKSAGYLSIFTFANMSPNMNPYNSKNFKLCVKLLMRSQ